MNPGGLKQCSHCHRRQPLTEYNLDRKRPDQRQRNCKTCARKLANAWNAAHPDRRAEQRKRRTS